MQQLRFCETLNREHKTQFLGLAESGHKLDCGMKRVRETLQSKLSAEKCTKSLHIWDHEKNYHALGTTFNQTFARKLQIFKCAAHF